MFNGSAGRSHARAFTCTDATGTPINSPVADGTSDITLVAPAKACAVSVHVTVADARITKGSGSMVVPQNTYLLLPCEAGDTIVIDRTTTTVINFVFWLRA